MSFDFRFTCGEINELQDQISGFFAYQNDAKEIDMDVLEDECVQVFEIVRELHIEMRQEAEEQCDFLRERVDELEIQEEEHEDKIVELETKQSELEDYIASLEDEIAQLKEDN